MRDTERPSREQVRRLAQIRRWSFAVLALGMPLTFFSAPLAVFLLWLFVGGAAWFGLDSWCGGVPCPDCGEPFFSSSQLSVSCRACGSRAIEHS